MIEIEGYSMDSLKKKLGARIQKLRKAQKLTQEKLSEIIDLDTPNLSNIECGRRFMTATTLQKIADALHVEVMTLFDFKEKENELKNNLFLKLDVLSEKELKFVFDVVQGIINLR